MKANFTNSHPKMVDSRNSPARWTPEFVAAAAQLACLLEVSAEKPGNVTPTHAFGDMGYEDFLRSTAALGPEIAQAGRRGTGATVLAAVRARQRWTQANTNLGILLLFTPLAKAALLGGGNLRVNLRQVLAELTIDDARQTYVAIRQANPGGLDHRVEHDIREEPAITLREAMASAATRDSIAAEYVSDYAITFEQGLPLFQSNLAGSDRTNLAVVQTYLELLAARPDTLIVRKCGAGTARDISDEAGRVLAAGGVFSPAGRQAITAFDRYLKRSPSNRLNPGTTADLIATIIFVSLLEGILI